MLEGAVESLACRLGLAFLVRGAQLLTVNGRPGALDVATYLGIGWLLANWWPHTNLQRVTGQLFAIRRANVCRKITVCTAPRSKQEQVGKPACC